MEAKRIALEAVALNTGIAVFRTADNQLQVNVPSEFSFDTDSAAIKPAMRPVLDRFADDLALPVLSHLLVRIVGHTDDRGRDAANDQLSLARARSVGKYLEGHGVAAARISVEGRGEHEPSVTNERGYGRALNRRVEMFLREPPAAP
jgi:outer membrane protein OmpA-like peptidoglycan-associated protein